MKKVSSVSCEVYLNFSEVQLLTATYAEAASICIILCLTQPDGKAVFTGYSIAQYHIQACHAVMASCALVFTDTRAP